MGVLQAASDGRPAAFADLLAADYRRLWLLAAALVGDRTEAEDLVQEAAIVGLSKYDQFQQGTNFTAWMSRIVRLLASNWRRKQARRGSQPTDPVDIDQQHGSPDEAPSLPAGESAAGRIDAFGEHFDDAVMEAIRRLPDTARACLLLRVVHDLPYDEISHLLEIPSGTAMSHVHRCRSRLRKQLADREVENA